MDTTTFINPTVVGWAEKNLILVKINAEDSTKSRSEYANSWGVRGYPTFILLRSDGTEIDRAYGYLDSAQFIATWTEYMNDINTLADLKRRAEKDPSAANFKAVGDRLRFGGKSVEAMSFLTRAVEADSGNSNGVAAQAMWAIGDLYRRDLDYPNAIARLVSMIETYPKAPEAADAELLIALCHTKAGDLPKAVAQYESFLKHYPNHVDTSYAREQIAELRPAR